VRHWEALILSVFWKVGAVVVNRQSPLSRVEDLLDGPAGERIHYLDQAMNLPIRGTMTTAMTLADTNLTRIGYLAASTDREFRRAVAVMQGRETVNHTAESSSIVSPSPVREAGFSVAEAESGSLHLLLEPFGLLQQVLFSRPVTTFCVALTLSQTEANILVWLRRRIKPRSHQSAERQAVTALREADGDAAVMLKGQAPQQTVEITIPRRARSTEDGQIIYNAIEVPRAYIEVDGEVKAAGRKITHIRNHPDGSQDIIYVEI
jgi:hypothetical protein